MYRKTLWVGGAVLAAVAASAWALVMVAPGGAWPAGWPKEMEPLRKRATTYKVAASNQETVYEIPFSDRTEFERLWPTILQVKDEGGKLTLCSVAKGKSKGLFAYDKPAVRIATPALGVSVKFKGEDKYVTPGPPWPDDLYDENGHLPEYVGWNGEQWVGTRPGGRGGFIYRARVDITLVVDGQIIDLNRIALPPDTVINDCRKLPSSNPEEDAEEDAPTSAPAEEPQEEPDFSAFTNPAGFFAPSPSE